MGRPRKIPTTLPRSKQPDEPVKEKKERKKDTVDSIGRVLSAFARVRINEHVLNEMIDAEEIDHSTFRRYARATGDLSTFRDQLNTLRKSTFKEAFELSYDNCHAALNGLLERLASADQEDE